MDNVELILGQLTKTVGILAEIVQQGSVNPDRELSLDDLQVVTGVKKRTWANRRALSQIWDAAFYPSSEDSSREVTTLNDIREARKKLAATKMHRPKIARKFKGRIAA